MLNRLISVYKITSSRSLTLKVEGTFSIKADREKVWEHMLSPDVLSACIPGCEEFKETGDGTYDVVLKVGISAMTGKYTGKVSLADVNHPESYRMIVEGKGAAGNIIGESLISLSENGEGTEVTVIGDARVTGIVARIGQRIMGGASRMLMNQFFACIKSKIERQ